MTSSLNDEHSPSSIFMKRFVAPFETLIEGRGSFVRADEMHMWTKKQPVLMSYRPTSRAVYKVLRNASHAGTTYLIFLFFVVCKAVRLGWQRLSLGQIRPRCCLKVKKSLTRALARLVNTDSHDRGVCTFLKRNLSL